MNINYQFDEQYKKRLRQSTKLTGKVENLIFEPRVNLIFENKLNSTAQYKIYPEMLFWWIDDMAGKFADKNLEEFDEDMMGQRYYLRWKDNETSIYFHDDSKNEIEIFKSDVSQKEMFERFRGLSKSLHEEMERINPLVKKSKEWVDYQTVNDYANQTSNK